jgi:murein DD-endopeptidase MepM/ murein hydrolase activator NlpD
LAVKRFLLLVVVLGLGALAAGIWLFKLEPGPPLVEFAGAPDVVGKQAAWEIIVRAQGRPPLRWVDVRLQAGGQSFPLVTEELRPDQLVSERRLEVAADLASAGIPEGAAKLEVFADTHAWHPFGGERGTRVSRDVTIDTTPPRLELLTTQHNMRLGGAALALFRVTGDATSAGVAVGAYYFPAVLGYFADPDVALAMLAVPQDLSVDAKPMVRASDAAGNSTEAALPVLIKARQFPERTLEIDDAFLQRKVPEILSAMKKPSAPDLKQGYLTINRDVRRESEEKLRALTASSADQPLWSGVFRRQSNSAPMSAFADRRSYQYQGETIDRQTHLGYDLASLKNAPVESAQDGVVVFADYLGIYGNTVVVDHGLGIFSLYGHLSTIAVKTGQSVKAGETLGQTGETGLAGGDHLHFSIMLRGTHVDPVEWWDGLWLRDHVTAPMQSLPAAAARAEPAPTPASGATTPDGKARS